MPEPREYRHIKAWGLMMHSFPYFIKNQQNEAADDDAPLNAIYKRDRWITFDEVENEETKMIVQNILDNMK